MDPQIQKKGFVNYWSLCSSFGKLLLQQGRDQNYARLSRMLEELCAIRFVWHGWNAEMQLERFNDRLFGSCQVQKQHEKGLSHQMAF